jgi:hypothetical protein
MRPVDFRNFTWAQVQEHIGDDMRRVHEAWRVHGPGTTREVAERSGISLLTFRPRTTDLYHLGLIECNDCKGNAGVYAFVSEELAEARQKWKQLPMRSGVQAPRATAAPTKTELSHAASIMARARATRRSKPTGASLLQPELFSLSV